MTIVRVGVLCAAIVLVSSPVLAQRLAAAGVVGQAVSAKAILPVPSADSSHRTGARAAVAVVGVAVGAYAGVAAVEIYRANSGISSHRGKRGADYVGAVIGATLFGVGTWLLSGKWL